MKKPDFIGMYESVFSKEYCEEVMSFFDEYEKSGMSESRRDHGFDKGTRVEDSSCFASSISAMRLAPSITKHFNETFWTKVYPNYANEYPILRDLSEHKIVDIKLQKTRPGEGYHVWHCEHGCLNSAKRVMAYTVYLNDDYEAGETEFLYQQKRIKAKQGDVMIFPASYTHTHRGNPPMKSNKYIMTGWLEF
jgi:hypothetical protein